MTEEITHGKVVGRVLRASNTTPEVEPDPTYAAIPSARVEFKAQLPTPWFKALMSSDPTSVFLQTFWAETDDDGYIVDAAGNHGIMLPASVDPSLGYSEWVWRATIKTAVAATVAVDFVLPAFTAEGDEVDVTTVARVPADPGRELGAWDALYLRARNQVARVQAAGSAAVADIEDAAGGVEQRAVAAATAAAADYTVQSGQARDEARSAASDAAAVVDTVTAQAQHATAEASRAKAEADRAQGAADSIDVTLSTEATAGTVPVRGAGGVLPGIGAPVSGTDAATKQYVDSVVPADHAWQALVLNPGFTGFDSPAVCIRAGRVCFRGSVKRTAGVFPANTTGDTAMFVLDDWARPTAYGRHVLPGYGSATANGLGVTVSASTGQVVGYGVGASMDQAYLDSLGWPAK